MPVDKMVNKMRKLNNEDIKSKLGMKKYIDEIKEMGWKKFWKANNKVFYLVGYILTALILITLFLNSRIIVLIKTDESWAGMYFLASTAIFILITIYIINFMLTIGIKQDYNTDNFMRTKMGKLKGIDWKSAEEPFVKKKKN